MNISPHDIEIEIPAEFRPFDPQQPLRCYTRKLPYWRQPGATYFVTFRLEDSIPRHVWGHLQNEAIEWKMRLARERARAGGVSQDLLRDYEKFQRRHYSRVERVLDLGAGSCALRSEAVRNIVAGALQSFNRRRYTLHAWVVMPNHVHLVVTPDAEWELEQALQSWKGYTTKAINAHLKRTGMLWQSESYDRMVRDAAHFACAVRYIAFNPRKARLRDDDYSLWLGCGRILGPHDRGLAEPLAHYTVRSMRPCVNGLIRE